MVPENIKEIFRRASKLTLASKTGGEEGEAYRFLVDTTPRNDNRLVEQFCVTPEQRKWMQVRNLTVEKMVSGKIAVKDCPTAYAFYKDWNTKLGVKWFQEDNPMQGMWDTISDTFGGMGVKSVQFGDEKPVKLGGDVNKRFDDAIDQFVVEEEDKKNQNSTLASEVLKLVRKTKDKLGNGIR